MSESLPKSPEAKPKKPIRTLRNRFIAGLFVVAPLLGTIWIVRFFYELLQSYGDPVTDFLTRSLRAWPSLWSLLSKAGIVFHDHQGDHFTPWIGNLSSLVLPILFIVFLGIIATNAFGKRLLAAFDHLLESIPLVATIYKTIKQVIQSFSQFGDTEHFQAVVYVDYPAIGHRLIGFVTGNYRDEKLQRDFVCIFLPTSPNPISGFVLIVDPDKITPAGIAIDDALKMVVSCGFVAPGSPEVLPEKMSFAEKG
jgi:uncharacterized membrane protein